MKVTEDASKEFEEEEALRIKKTRCTAQTRYNTTEPCLYDDKMLSDESQPDAMNSVDLWSEDDGNQVPSLISLQKLVPDNMQEDYPITPSSPLPQRRRSMIKNTSSCGKTSLILSNTSELWEETGSFVETQQDLDTHDRHNTDQCLALKFPWRQSNLEDIFSQLAMDDQGLIKEDFMNLQDEATGYIGTHTTVSLKSPKQSKPSCLNTLQGIGSSIEVDSVVHSSPSARVIAKSIHGDQEGLRPEDASFSHAEGHLIRHITGLHPWDEWDQISVLDLTGRSAESVIKLNHLVPRLEVLLLNENHVSHLTGVPMSVKTLQARNNLLIDLTSFGHLINLQYLDISNNGIEDLTGLSSLVHLRDLSVEGNKVKSLLALQQMDGLIRLNLSRNCLTQLDFRESRL